MARPVELGPPGTRGFLHDAIAESRSIMPSPVFKGQYFDRIRGILDAARTNLHTIRQDLPDELFTSDDYQFYYSSRTTRDAKRNLSRDEKKKVEHARRLRNLALGNLTREDINPTLQGQTLHTVDSPSVLRRQSGIGRCSLATFATIYEGIAKQYIDQWRLSQSILEVIPESRGSTRLDTVPILHMDNYLAVLKTPAFQRRHSKQVRTLSLFGSSFEDISGLIQRLKTKDPDINIYCTLNIAGQRDSWDGVWHNAILTDVSDHTVVAHDTSHETHGGPNRVFDKDRFISRWSKGYLSGSLVIFK